MTSNSGMAFDGAMDLAESMDLPDGAFWAMAHDLAGLDCGCGFPPVTTKRPKRRAAVHAQLMEPRNAAKPHRCGTCAKEFATKGAKRQHRRDAHKTAQVVA